MSNEEAVANLIFTGLQPWQLREAGEGVYHAGVRPPDLEDGEPRA